MVHLLREDCTLEKLPLEDLLQMEELSSKVVDKPWGRKGPSANKRCCSSRRRVRRCKASNSPSKNNSLLLYAISLQAQLAGVSTPSPMQSNAEAARALRGVDPGVVDLTGGAPGGSNGGHTTHTTNPTRKDKGDKHTRKCRTGGHAKHPARGGGTRLIRANSERRRREEPAGGAAGEEASSSSGGGRVSGGRAGAG